MYRLGYKETNDNYLNLEENGVAKRKNRTLVKMARSIIQIKKFTNSYWVEAIRITLYIQNRRLNMTSYEALFERKPNVLHLNIFGCLTYIKVTNEKRYKLDTKVKLVPSLDIINTPKYIGFIIPNMEMQFLMKGEFRKNKNC